MTLSKLGATALAGAAIVLLCLNVRLLARLGALEEKLDRRLRAEPGFAPAAGGPPSAEAPISRSTPSAPPLPASLDLPRDPEAVGSAPATALEALVSKLEIPRPETTRRPPVASQGSELTDDQKRSIAALQEAHRKERLQIEGDAAARRLEADQRYDSLVRAWLTSEQQQRFDLLRRASTPDPNGPLTPQAQEYLARDRAPYDLEVEWQGTWWPARTVSVQGGLTLIHYVGHGEEWHEWVTDDRRRTRRP